MIEVWRIQFDSNFVKQFPPPRDLLWIETIRSDQVGPNLHASLFPRTSRFTADRYVRANKESHPANQDGQKKKGEGKERTSVLTSFRVEAIYGWRTTYNPR